MQEGKRWRVVLRLGCPSPSLGLEFVVQLLEPQLKILNEPPRLVQADLGAEPELVGMFSVRREVTGARSQRLPRSHAGRRARVPVPAAAELRHRELHGPQSLRSALPPLLARPRLSFPYSIFSSQPCSVLFSSLSWLRPVAGHGLSPLGSFKPGSVAGKALREGGFETEPRSGKGTPWLESPEGRGNQSGVVPWLWKKRGCETLGSARTLLLRGVCVR